MTTKCNLIIDSCCDLPYAVVDRPGVDIIRFPYLIDGAERLDDMYHETTPKEFYDVMRDKNREKPTTAQVPATMLSDAFKRALDSGVPTVYLAFTSGLSGSFDTAILTRDALIADYPDAELHLVDTKLASVAEGLLVLEAINQREKGLTATEMVSWAEEARWFVNHQFMVDDLESLRRGGRIPAGVALAGAKLDVKPLLSFDMEGKLSMVGMARGRKKGIRQIAEYFRKRTDGAYDTTVIVANADVPGDMRRMRDDIEKTNPGTVFLETSIGPVIGSHVGPGMIAIAFWGTDRREDIGVADRIAKRVKEKR